MVILQAWICGVVLCRGPSISCSGSKKPNPYSTTTCSADLRVVQPLPSEKCVATPGSRYISARDPLARHISNRMDVRLPLSVAEQQLRWSDYRRPTAENAQCTGRSPRVHLFFHMPLSSHADEPSQTCV